MIYQLEWSSYTCFANIDVLNTSTCLKTVRTNKHTHTHTRAQTKTHRNTHTQNNTTLSQHNRIEQNSTQNANNTHTQHITTHTYDSPRYIQASAYNEPIRSYLQVLHNQEWEGVQTFSSTVDHIWPNSLPPWAVRHVSTMCGASVQSPSLGWPGDWKTWTCLESSSLPRSRIPEPPASWWAFSPKQVGKFPSCSMFSTCSSQQSGVESPKIC